MSKITILSTTRIERNICNWLEQMTGDPHEDYVSEIVQNGMDENRDEEGTVFQYSDAELYAIGEAENFIDFLNENYPDSITGDINEIGWCEPIYSDLAWEAYNKRWESVEEGGEED